MRQVRVAMYDESEERRKPIFSFLHAVGLAEIEMVQAPQRPDAAPRAGWAVAATKEDWGSRARNLHENKLCAGPSLRPRLHPPPPSPSLPVPGRAGTRSLPSATCSPKTGWGCSQLSGSSCSR